MLHETKDVPLFPLYHPDSRTSSPTPSTPTNPPPLYSPSRPLSHPRSSPFPPYTTTSRTSRSAKRKSLSPTPKDNRGNRRKAFICIAVGVVVLLVIPLTVFGGILHATRHEKQQCANEGILDGVRVCES